MKAFRLLFWFLIHFASLAAAFGGSATLVSDSTNGLSSSFTRTANVNLDSYNATSVTVSVSAWARYYSAFTASDSAVVNVFVQAGPANFSQGGSSEITLPVSATFTKTGGQWYYQGSPVGSNVFARGSVELFNIGPETGVGEGSVTISVSWVDAPANASPSVSWTSAPNNVPHGQSYTVSAHGHDADGNLTQVNVWRGGAGFAFAGGGNGFDGDSGNSTTDSGPQTITYTAQAVDSSGATSPTISHTVTIDAPPPVNHAPTISWTATPGTVASGQAYTVSAHGHDDDGNLTQVNVWRNGSGFAFAGGGNGTDGDSGNSATDGGPQTITYTAQAVDSNGATSATISQVVTISAPPPVNQAPTISWNSTPGTVASGQAYSVSAHGHDADGNLTQVNVWRNGVGFAFAGGGNGSDGDSGNSATDTGPQSITYTAQAVDSNGANSATISQVVTISAPPPVNQAPTISWNSTPGTVANGQAYSVSAHGHDADGNLTQVNVWRNGVGFAFAGGGNGSDGDSGNSATDSGPQSITYTAQAVDSSGANSATISQVVTISAPPPVNQAPTIAWNSTPGTVASGQAYSVSAHGHDADGNLTQVNVWRNGSAYAFAGGGNGTDGDSGNSSTDAGPQTITYTAQSVDSNGLTSATISQVVTISAPPPVNQAPTVAWNSTPGTVASGQSYTVSAHGHDPDGNLTQVNVWRDGVAFAFAGGGNGTDGDSGNSRADTGPASVTYTAQAVDSNGAVSATISQVVTISAPPPVNQAPTISWNSTPGTVASGQAYSISAHGRDADGNLMQVNVWRNGVGFAFAGGGNGIDGDSGNSATDVGPQTITYTAQAVDSNGATSVTISQVVTISAPPPVNQAPTIVWNSTPGTVASGQPYSVSAHGHDADGNLIQVNVWRDGSPYAFAGGGNGTDGDSGNSSIDIGPLTITYTAQAVDSNGLTSATISQVVTISAPPPVNQAPTIAWISTPGTVASGQSYTISAHGHDADGNLTQVNVWRDGVGFAFAGGGNGTDGDSGNSRADTGPVSVTYTAQAVDANGAVSATISQVVTISAPPPVLYSLTTSTTGGGSVSVGGTFVAGTPATVIATPAANFSFAGWTGDLAGTTNPATVLMDADKAVQAVFVPVTVTLTTLATVGGSVSPGGAFPVGMAVAVTATADPAYDFVGWTVDLGGTSNPGSVVMNAAKTVRANFALKAFALSTSATAGGSVTAGGTYPPGVTVSISATPDAGHFFSGWSGDATGTGNPVAILMDRAKSVTALFTAKADQTITFATLGNRSVDDSDIALTATASSGLPVTFALVSGPATLTGNLLRITGPGAIAITASQPGDALFNPAPDVTRTLNAVAAPTVRYSDGRTTILSTANAKGGAHFVVERP